MSAPNRFHLQHKTLQLLLDTGLAFRTWKFWMSTGILQLLVSVPITNTCPWFTSHTRTLQSPAGPAWLGCATPGCAPRPSSAASTRDSLRHRLRAAVETQPDIWGWDDPSLPDSCRIKVVPIPNITWPHCLAGPGFSLPRTGLLFTEQPRQSLGWKRP